MSGRQVLVDAELLEKVLENHRESRFPYTGGMGVDYTGEYEVCVSCSEVMPGMHAKGCPVPVLQAALAQPEAQPGSSAGEVLRLMVDWLEAKHHAEGDPLVFTHWEEHRNRCRPLQIAIEALDPAHLRTLAQTQADQQTLVEKWRERGERHHDAGIAGCADELEAVLGGKE